MPYSTFPPIVFVSVVPNHFALSHYVLIVQTYDAKHYPDLIANDHDCMSFENLVCFSRFQKQYIRDYKYCQFTISLMNALINPTTWYMPKSYCIRRRNHLVCLPMSLDMFRIHFRAWWSVPIVNGVPLRHKRWIKFAQTTARHFRWVASEFGSGSFKNFYK